MDKDILLKAKRHLRRNDPVMAQLIKDFQPFSLESSGFVKKVNHFHTLVRTIISQQLSVKAAQTIQNRLQKRQGGRVFNAAKLDQLSDVEIRECGISKNKIRYIRAIAQAVINKQLNFKKLEKLNDDDIIDCLIQYPGIGQWSAEMFLMISFKRLDVLPLGDLIIRKTMKNLYGLETDCHYDEYRNIARSWQPYRSIASRYLWASS